MKAEFMHPLIQAAEEEVQAEKGKLIPPSKYDTDLEAEDNKLGKDLVNKMQNLSLTSSELAQIVAEHKERSDKIKASTAELKQIAEKAIAEVDKKLRSLGEIARAAKFKPPPKISAAASSTAVTGAVAKTDAASSLAATGLTTKASTTSSTAATGLVAKYPTTGASSSTKAREKSLREEKEKEKKDENERLLGFSDDEATSSTRTVGRKRRTIGDSGEEDEGESELTFGTPDEDDDGGYASNESTVSADEFGHLLSPNDEDRYDSELRQVCRWHFSDTGCGQGERCPLSHNPPTVPFGKTAAARSSSAAAAASSTSTSAATSSSSTDRRMVVKTYRVYNPVDDLQVDNDISSSNITVDSSYSDIADGMREVLIHDFDKLPQQVRNDINGVRRRRADIKARQWVDERADWRRTYDNRRRYSSADTHPDDHGRDEEEFNNLKVVLVQFRQVIKYLQYPPTFMDKDGRTYQKSATVHYTVPVNQQCDQVSFASKKQPISAMLKLNETALEDFRLIFKKISALFYERWWAKRSAVELSGYGDVTTNSALISYLNIANKQFEAVDSLLERITKFTRKWKGASSLKETKKKFDEEYGALVAHLKPEQMAQQVIAVRGPSIEAKRSVIAKRARQDTSSAASSSSAAAAQSSSTSYRQRQTVDVTRDSDVDMTGDDSDAESGQQSGSSTNSAKRRKRASTVAGNYQFNTAASQAIRQHQQSKNLTEYEERIAAEQLETTLRAQGGGGMGHTQYARRLKSGVAKLAYICTVARALPNYFQQSDDANDIEKFMRSENAYDSSSTDDEGDDADTRAARRSTSATAGGIYYDDSSSSSSQRQTRGRDSASEMSDSSQNDGGAARGINRSSSSSRRTQLEPSGSRDANRPLGVCSRAYQRRWANSDAWKYGVERATANLQTFPNEPDPVEHAQRRLTEIRRVNIISRNASRIATRAAVLDSASDEERSDRVFDAKRTRYNAKVMRAPRRHRNEQIVVDAYLPIRYINMSGRAPAGSAAPRRFDSRATRRDSIALDTALGMPEREVARATYDPWTSTGVAATTTAARASRYAEEPEFDDDGVRIPDRSPTRRAYTWASPMSGPTARAAAATPPITAVRPHAEWLRHVKMEKFDPFTMTAQNFHIRFQNFCNQTGVPLEAKAALFINFIKDSTVFNEMSECVFDSSTTPRQKFEDVKRVFDTAYAPNTHTVEANQHKLRQMHKQIDENVKDYIVRFDNAYSMAYPDHVNVSEKIKEFIPGLDSAMISAYQRAGINRDTVRSWSEFKAIIERMYQTRTAAEIDSAVAEFAEHRHYAPKYGAANLDELLTNESNRRQPFVNPPINSRASAYVKRSYGRDLKQDGSDAVEEPTRQKQRHDTAAASGETTRGQSSTHDKSTRSERRQALENRRINAAVSEYAASVQIEPAVENATSEHDDDATTDDNISKPKRKMNVVTKREAEHSSRQSSSGSYSGTGSNNTPVGVKKEYVDQSRWDPKVQCAGHEHSCGLRGHRWDYCQRNPNARNHRPAFLNYKGPAREYGTGVNSDSPTTRGVHNIENIRRIPGNAAESAKLNLQIAGRIRNFPTPRLLVDSGAESSLMHVDTWKKIRRHDVVLRPTPIHYVNASGESMDALGDITVALTLYDKETGRSVTLPSTFTIMKTLNCQLILGMETLRDFFGVINLESNRCEFRKDLAFDAETAPANVDPRIESRLTVRKGVCLPARHTVSVAVRFESQLVVADGPDTVVLCEPMRLFARNGRPINITFPSHVCNGRQANPGQYMLIVTNPTDEDVMLHSGDHIGRATVIDKKTVCSTLADYQRVIDPSIRRRVIASVARAVGVDPAEWEDEEGKTDATSSTTGSQ